MRLQKDAADADKTPGYPLQNPLVYNKALDSITEDDNLKLIVVADNPGKDEQRDENCRYLVGQAGKIGDGFFRRHPELEIDFRKNVIILNKTPIHTAKTKQLASLLKNGGERFRLLFEETQRWMARETAALQNELACDLWLVGYGELRTKGLFTVYADELAARYRNSGVEDCVFVYQHFSMNCFSIDLNRQYNRALNLTENLRHVGLLHRKEILGW